MPYRNILINHNHSATHPTGSESNDPASSQKTDSSIASPTTDSAARHSSIGITLILDQDMQDCPIPTYSAIKSNNVILTQDDNGTYAYVQASYELHAMDYDDDDNNHGDKIIRDPHGTGTNSNHLNDNEPHDDDFMLSCSQKKEEITLYKKNDNQETKNEIYSYCGAKKYENKTITPLLAFNPHDNEALYIIANVSTQHSPSYATMDSYDSIALSSGSPVILKFLFKKKTCLQISCDFKETTYLCGFLPIPQNSRLNLPSLFMINILKGNAIENKNGNDSLSSQNSFKQAWKEARESQETDTNATDMPLGVNVIDLDSPFSFDSIKASGSRKYHVKQIVTTYDEEPHSYLRVTTSTPATNESKSSQALKC